MEDLKIKRYEILEIIKREEHEKSNLEKDLALLQGKIATLTNNLHQHKVLFDNYDKTIKDTENGFKKVKIKARRIKACP